MSFVVRLDSLTEMVRIRLFTRERVADLLEAGKRDFLLALSRNKARFATPERKIFAALARHQGWGKAWSNICSWRPELGGNSFEYHRLRDFFLAAQADIDAVLWNLPPVRPWFVTWEGLSRVYPGLLEIEAVVSQAASEGEPCYQSKLRCCRKTCDVFDQMPDAIRWFAHEVVDRHLYRIWKTARDKARAEEAQRRWQEARRRQS